MIPTLKTYACCHIRWLIRRDFPSILAIEHASSDHPRCEEDFLTLLRQRDHIGMVAEHGDRIVAFMIYRLSPQKIDLLTLAVDPARRRQGVGAQMVAKLKGKLSSHRRTRIELVARERNAPGLAFMKSQGFTAIELIREHYADSGEDGIRFVFDHADEEADR